MMRSRRTRSASPRFKNSRWYAGKRCVLSLRNLESLRVSGLDLAQDAATRGGGGGAYGVSGRISGYRGVISIVAAKASVL